jgi:iron-sulfur cluster assembly accessory protein
MVTLTPKAAQKVKALAQKEGKPGAFLRVRIVSGGCSGMSYEFIIDDTMVQGDLVSETDGAKAVVDPKSNLFVDGSVLDYSESLMKSGFEITNPQAKSGCGCGKSFNTEDAAPAEESFSV